MLWCACWIASGMAMIWIWDNWTTSLTLFCWFVAALELKKPSQPGEIVPLILHFINSRFCSIYELLHCCDFFGDIGTHPNVIFLQVVRFRGWVVMKNNETCNALKCLKPSGLIDWINCRLCNGWVHIKCALSLANFKCSRCSLVNTISQCKDDNFRPDTFLIQALFTWEEFLKTHGSP